MHVFNLQFKNRWLTLNTLILVALLLGNVLLLAPAGGVLRVSGAMIVLLLPGLAWAERLALSEEKLVCWVVGLGLSYALVVIFGLLLHYIPGNIPAWMVWLVLNLLTAGAIIRQRFWKTKSDSASGFTFRFSGVHLILLTVLFCGAFFRFSDLGYREFQGDEIKPMIDAAEAIDGREATIFISRKKGPGEIMIPLMQWSLTGTTSEAIARFPFALVGLLSILTIHVLAGKLIGEKAGLIAAGLLALNGFMVGFSRILQYQQIVIWFSLLVLLCAWEWRQSEKARWPLLIGLFLGVGLLFHYDIVIIVPALIYLLGSKPKSALANVKLFIVSGLITAAIAALFLIPFTMNPQAEFTANYVGGRIGGSLINNNLFDFYHYTIFYDSFSYVIITGLLVLGFLVWSTSSACSRKWLRPGCYFICGILVALIIFISVYPDALRTSGLDFDFAFSPFTLVLLGAFLSPSIGVGHKVVIVWLATAFLGYTFVVTDPRTHFYTISPAWVMLAATAGVWGWEKLASVNRALPAAITLFLAVLFGGYLYLVFLRSDVEFRNEYPQSQPALYWSPYAEPPRHEFGFVHKVGWKAVGGLYATGRLEGRFDTNSGSGLRRWYTRQVGWGCGCCQPQKYYFAFDYKGIDPTEFTGYGSVGQIKLPTNGKGVTIYQSAPIAEQIAPIAVDELHQAFDRTARPTAFIWPEGEHVSAEVNLANLFNLTGYDLIIPAARPGEELAVKLHWQRGQEYMPVNFNVFVRLEDGAGNIWGQSMSPPVCGQRVTTEWSEDETIIDSHIVVISPETPPGEYVISAGMVVPNENFRLPVLDETGQPVAESVELGTVIID